ncbi:MAG: hypothetical protein ACXVCY_01475 [Pseudobdellovibrionaceae bacterium]
MFPKGMGKKKKNSTAAENLIDSLMDDLKDIHAESSYKSANLEDDFAGLPTLDSDDHRVEKTSVANNFWTSLEKGIEKDLEPPEFTGSEESQFGEGPSSDFEMPEGFADLPSPGSKSQPKFQSESQFPFEAESESESAPEIIPAADSEYYVGPSAGGEYQSPDEIFGSSDIPEPPTSSIAVDDSTRPVGFFGEEKGEEKTVSIQQDLNNATSVIGTEAEKTLAVEGFANARLGARSSHNVDVKVSIGNHRGSRGSANVMTSVDASLAQAENLKLAQQRILELEKEVETLRSENEELASAGEIIRGRTDELSVRITALEKEKVEIQESAQSEILILKGNLQYKENEGAKARLKVDELETRLKSDFKKIRVRERELENRLELLRAEKSALVRSKDEYILEQKRKIDQLSQELDNYRKKCLELNKTIEANQDQVKRTERALRLALTNLEAKEENNVPLKKAE